MIMLSDRVSALVRAMPFLVLCACSSERCAEGTFFIQGECRPVVRPIDTGPTIDEDAGTDDASVETMDADLDAAVDDAMVDDATIDAMIDDAMIGDAMVDDAMVDDASTCGCPEERPVCTQDGCAQCDDDEDCAGGVCNDEGDCVEETD
jgi:hypothetical protein